MSHVLLYACEHVYHLRGYRVFQARRGLISIFTSNASESGRTCRLYIFIHPRRVQICELYKLHTRACIRSNYTLQWILLQPPGLCTLRILIYINFTYVDTENLNKRLIFDLINIYIKSYSKHLLWGLVKYLNLTYFDPKIQKNIFYILYFIIN